MVMTLVPWTNKMACLTGGMNILLVHSFGTWDKYCLPLNDWSLNFTVSKFGKLNCTWARLNIW